MDNVSKTPAKNKKLLTLLEARREFDVLGKAFDDFATKTKHLKASTCLASSLGGSSLIKTSDKQLPWMPLLFGAANLMDAEGDSPAEIRANFDRFLREIVETHVNTDGPKALLHPFELMRFVMVATVNELMPVLRPMHEFTAIVARAGGEDELKMALVNAFHRALLGVLERSTNETRTP